jgi:hypothetical protein
MTAWTEGLTQADPEADWEKMSPEAARVYIEAAVDRLEHLSHRSPPGDSTAKECAQEILTSLTFGNVGNARSRLEAIIR